MKNKEIKFETLKKSHKKQIIIGSVLVCVVGSILTFNLTKAKYRLTQSMKLVTGTINYKVPDMRVVALYTKNDNNEYVESDNVPTSGYTLNEEKSICRVYDGTTSVAEAPKDELITIEYKDGRIYINDLTKKNTRCYLYFDLIEDSEKPIITKVETSSTENSITINVEATDNIGVDKYYYQIDSEEVIEKTESSHTFTGLILGSSHTIKVYVKDGRGNTSEETTKTVSTVGAIETTLAKLNINPSYIKEGNPNFAATATGAETAADNGIYKTSDPMYSGETYYWRGAATSNHVIFANKCWRIVRINGDGTIRLIYNGTPSGDSPNQTCPGNGSNSGSIAITSQTYSKGSVYDNSAYVGYTYTVSKQRPEGTPEESNLKTQTETWFNNNSNFTDAQRAQVAEGKYCNDRNTKNNEEWSATGGTFNYAARERLQTNKTPTLACEEEDVYTLKAGAITADEVSMAGGVYGSTNQSYYLYNGQYYWTMSPSFWNGYAGAYVFYVQDNGRLNDTLVYNAALGVRPAINLRSDVTFNLGSDGTQNNPYIVQ